MFACSLRKRGILQIPRAGRFLSRIVPLQKVGQIIGTLEDLVIEVAERLTVREMTQEHILSSKALFGRYPAEKSRYCSPNDIGHRKSSDCPEGLNGVSRVVSCRVIEVLRKAALVELGL